MVVSSQEKEPRKWKRRRKSTVTALNNINTSETIVLTYLESVSGQYLGQS